jgi:hypothetical protein
MGQQVERGMKLLRAVEELLANMGAMLASNRLLPFETGGRCSRSGG